MNRRKTYVDAGVLIAVARGENELAVKAIQILDDPMREFVASPFLKLEVLPKAVYTNRQAEVEFYGTFFAAVSHWVDAKSDVVEKAQEIANAFGLGAMDALHVAAAIFASADELVTTEKPSKPIHRVSEVQVFSIQE